MKVRYLILAAAVAMIFMAWGTNVTAAEEWSPDKIEAAGGFESDRNAYTVIYDHELSGDSPVEVSVEGPAPDPALPAVYIYWRPVYTGVAADWMSKGMRCPIDGERFSCKFTIIPIFDFASPVEIIVGAIGDPEDLMDRPHSPSLLLSEYVTSDQARNDNCIDVPTISQTNQDGDRWANSCDNDIDHDGWVNEADNCDYLPNPIQRDSDINREGCNEPYGPPIIDEEEEKPVEEEGAGEQVPGEEEEGEEVPGTGEEGIVEAPLAEEGLLEEAPLTLDFPTALPARKDRDWGHACSLCGTATANPAGFFLLITALVPLVFRRR